MCDMSQLTIANPADWCTVAYAAELLNVSQRTIGRMIRDGRLQACRPLVGSRESARHKVMIYVPTVREYARALTTVRGEADGHA